MFSCASHPTIRRRTAAPRLWQVLLCFAFQRFLFGGRLVFGPDVKSLMVTLFLIIVPAVIFCVYVARNLMHRFGKNSGIAIIVVFVVYTILVLTFLLLTSGRDPGIIPRNLRPPEVEEEGDTRGSPTDWGAPGQRLRVFRTKDIVVNGVAVRVKYCDTCMLYRPPRCSHCSICNNCVERFDHHCPWVGQCIGQRNYRFFFYFVSSATTLCIFVFAMSAVYIKFLMDEHQSSAWAAMRRSPASVALMAFTFVAVWFVGGLTLFHLYLIGTNQTTYENFRYRYDNRINPYNLDVVNNFKEIFCTKIPSSKNKFRAKAPEDTGSPRFTGSPILAAKYGNVGIEIPGSWNNQPAEKRIYQSGETQGRTQNGENAASEVKEGYEHCASNRVIPECGDSAPHSGQRSSSTGRRSGSWEITPEAITMAANVGEGGRVNGISTPPGNR